MMDDIEMRVADALITKQADRITTLEATLRQAREALDKLARLGNEPLIGNSIGNTIAAEALAAIDAVLKEGK